MLAILVAVVLVASFFFRRRARSLVAHVPQPTVEPPPPVPVRSPKDVLHEQLARLQTHPTRANVMVTRKMLWAMAGAAEGETLGDVLGGLQERSPELHPLLRLTERAAFIADIYLQGAIDDMILALEHYLA